MAIPSIASVRCGGRFFPGDLQNFTFGSIEVHLPILTAIVQAVKIPLQKLISAGVINGSIKFGVIHEESNS